MQPDGISYLDVGDSFFRHGLGERSERMVESVIPVDDRHSSRHQQAFPKVGVPLVHVVNFAIFVITLFTFRFFLHALLGFRRGKLQMPSQADR